MNLPPERFLSATLRQQDWGKPTARILAASLDAVQPGKAVQRHLSLSGNQLRSGELVLDLSEFQRVFLLAVGKAAIPMAVQACEILEGQLDKCLILAKGVPDLLPEGLPQNRQLFQGGHPIPTPESVRATREILAELGDLEPKDLVIFLLSGGGSALLCDPAGGLSLADLQDTNRELLRCGASIQEINTIRKHLSRVKGGRLQERLRPARSITLILSDVIGDAVDMIASGPTAPDPTSYQDALAVVRLYSLESTLPPAVLEHLEAGAEGTLPETPKPGDPVFLGTSQTIIASNRDALRGGLAQARAEKLSARILPESLAGEAHLAGLELARLLRDPDQLASPPACVLAGGETTVTLPPGISEGRGGRNLELALSAVHALDGLADTALISLATDGEDGSTDAAGAVVSGESYRRARDLGLDPGEHLARHDSYSFFKALDDLIITGPTGTNVNDLCFLFKW